jgi:hypothetical protein
MMKMKTCSMCSVEKAEIEYYKDPRKHDGLRPNCKTCHKASAKRWTDANKEKMAAWKAENKPMARAAAAKWRERNRDKDRQRNLRTYQARRDRHIENVKKYQRENPEKTAAHVTVTLALQNGSLTRQPCEVCGKEKTDAHHDDYSKPLEVRWLCRPHHKQHHASRGEKFE